MSNFNYKQVILVRQDLKLPKGKACAQCSHASVEATLRSDSNIVANWRMEGMAKIVLKVHDEKELIKYFQMAKEQGITASLITDAGHTVVRPGTKTCAALGPDTVDNLDPLVKDLKLL